jgi:hypothetical protein
VGYIQDAEKGTDGVLHAKTIGIMQGRRFGKARAIWNNMDQETVNDGP